MMSDTLPIIAGAGVILALFFVVYLVRGKRRTAKKIGNAPMGTDSRVSQIGRRAEEQAQSKKSQPVKKWGRGTEE